jgi:hypothetical protein
MTAHWHVRRTVSAQETGQQRWDRTYQCLLQWIAEGSAASSHPRKEEEMLHGSRPVCASLNPTAATDADH